MSSTNSESSASDTDSSSNQVARHQLAGSKRKRSTVEDDSSDDASSSEREEASDPEVEVLSHAAQRKRKKQLSKAAQQSAEGPSVNSTTSSKPATETLAKRQNSIWVGNLSFKTTPTSLRSFFDGVGQVTRIHMPMKLPSAPVDGADARRTGRQRLDNRGFAYVDFASPDAKQIAIAMSEQELDGRKLLIKDGEDFAGRPAPPALPAGTQSTGSSGDGHSKTVQKILASQKQPPAPTLFFGNLGFEATPESLQEMLDAHASQLHSKSQQTIVEPNESGSNETPNKGKAGIRKVRLGTFEDSGLCKGFGFVDFHTTEQATAALINLRNHHLDGRKLVVEYASADAVRRGGGGGPRKSRDNYGQKSVKRSGADNIDGEPAKRVRVDKEDTIEENEPAAPAPRSGKSRPGKLERMQAKGLAPPRSAGPPAAETRKPQRRPNPGAVLANAPRGSAAILPAQGQKIVF